MAYKLYDLQCLYCPHKWELFAEFSDLPNAKCPKCGNQGKQLPSFSGYKIKGDNSASVTPKGSGSFKRGRK